MAWAVAGNIRGPAGTQGPTGATGPTGTPGAAGPAGLNWRGAWAAPNSFALDDSVGYQGSTFFTTAAIPANTATPPTSNPPGAVTTTNAPWQILSVEGAVGPTGATGPQGPTGAQGAAGATGSTGLQGAQGTQGPTGATGATGATGPTGPTGASGSTGVRGSQWSVGTGAPGTVTGSLPGDQYLDQASGNVYTLS